MKTPIVAIAVAMVPLTSFGATYSLAKTKRTAVHAPSTRPHCTGGRQRAMDGWSCTDWRLVDPETGKVSRSRVD